ncbi:MAG: transposase [Candidatus Micrarchaeota archaeon]
MRAYKFRLYPNKEQRQEMQTHLWLSKNLWNDMLELTKDLYNQYGYFATTKALREIAKNSGLFSQTAQDVEARLNKSIRGMIARRKKKINTGFPRFKNIDRVKSLTYPQSGFSLGNKKLKVTPFGEINIKKHREIQGEIKTLMLKREPSGKWFAIFTAEAAVQPIPMKEGESIGIDLGLMAFATLSNGEKIKKPKHMRIYEDKLADAQRELSTKRKGSKNRRKAKIIIGRIYQKVANTRKDWLHKTANTLLSQYSLIALEKLDVQGIAKEHGRGTGDAAWSIFTNILSYKAESAGCEVVFVNPKNTTKQCSGCSEMVRKELHERQHNCPSCGLNMDRDLNAAINILNVATSSRNSCGQKSQHKATDGQTGSNACGDGSYAI